MENIWNYYFRPALKHNWRPWEELITNLISPLRHGTATELPCGSFSGYNIKRFVQDIHAAKLSSSTKRISGSSLWFSKEFSVEKKHLKRLQTLQRLWWLSLRATWGQHLASAKEILIKSTQREMESLGEMKTFHKVKPMRLLLGLRGRVRQPSGRSRKTREMQGAHFVWGWALFVVTWKTLPVSLWRWQDGYTSCHFRLRHWQAQVWHPLPGLQLCPGRESESLQGLFPASDVKSDSKRHPVIRIKAGNSRRYEAKAFQVEVHFLQGRYLTNARLKAKPFQNEGKVKWNVNCN